MLPDQTTPGKAITLREGQDRKLKTPAPPPDHHVKCPRCDSPNTKFCYYNNYSLSQPRHFCKSCRRYWTEGGTLRNVPVGGGCRKNKKMKQRFLAGMLNSRDSDSGEGHNFFQGFVTPAMDFQLGSINPPSSSSMFPDIDTNFSLYDPRYNTSQFNPSHHQNSGEVGALTGYDYLRPAQSRGGGDKNSMVVHSNLASSIESLSSINQELHWKLQQQRLRALFSGNQSENLSTRPDLSQVENQFDHHQQQPETRAQKLQLQPILFQSLEPTMEGAEVPGQSGRTQGEDGGGSNSATEWFFDVSPYTNDVSNNKGGFANELDDSRMNQEVNDDNQTDNWNSGIQTWRYLQQYNGAFP